MEFRERIFNIIINFLLFWVVTDIFSGITIKEGLVGYIICGGMFGVAMLTVVPLIKFFTLPLKLVSVLILSAMISIMVFFLLNFGVPYIDFADGTLVGISNSSFEIPNVKLSMMTNVFFGGAVSGLLSGLMLFLEGRDF